MEQYNAQTDQMSGKCRTHNGSKHPVPRSATFGIEIHPQFAEQADRIERLQRDTNHSWFSRNLFEHNALG